MSEVEYIEVFDLDLYTEEFEVYCEAFDLSVIITG